MTAPQENYDPETGLLSAAGLDQALESELARSSRHEVPLSLVYLEVTGSGTVEVDATLERQIAARVAGAFLGAVRAEDRIARVGPLRFAVLAAEAGDAGALGARLSEHAAEQLRGIGVERDFSVAVAAVDCLFDEMTRKELLEHAERGLVAAIEEGRVTRADSPA